MAEKKSPKARILRLIEGFPKKRVLVLGDLMLDEFIRGKVRRISPEAPVPVVAVHDESHAPGGAGNVCSNIAALGGAVSVLSIVGGDRAGEALVADLQARRVDPSGVIRDPGRITTQKCRVVAEHQQVVRFDRDASPELSAQTQTRLLDRLRRRVSEAHALVLSDYGKGVVAPRVLTGAIAIARRAGIPVLVDPKVEHFLRYRGVDCITPNLQEAWGGMRLIPSHDDEAIYALGRKIVRTLRVKSVLITRGEKGMTLFSSNGGGIRHIPTRAKEVFDVTGAGDTVISVMALALASGAKPFDAAVLANLAAGIVVGKLGTATVSPEELSKAVREDWDR
ncbi:MAG TPA: D-glycero-beta-D-manno-heptose-7-phosphate kinase [Elusimicrobiota bacterium]|jgi:D-beta-D-heptose 7-phosphate kinase/D-beta-D-heptose 1-phosphate adenosyltransferase|nr:D-glycero-beta-D-manno-heptose-7-phosphate kinase [Elusimicrobiota bacterium]